MTANLCIGMTHITANICQKLTKTNAMAGNSNTSVGLRLQFEPDCRQKRSIFEENESSTEYNPKVSIICDMETKLQSANNQAEKKKKKIRRKH